jgi:uroporphyrinogen decarboxylase
VLATINHQEPDRVPLDLGGTRVSSIAVGAYDRLLRHLGLDGAPARVMDVWQMLAWVEQPVVDALGIDVLPVPRLVQDFGMRMDTWIPWQLVEDGTPVRMPGGFEPIQEEDGSLTLFLNGEPVAKKVPSSPYFDRLLDLRMSYDLPPLESVRLPLLNAEELAWRRHWAETLRAETDKALVGDFGFNLGRWGSYGEWFYGIAADKDYTRAWYDLKIENLLANVALYAEAVGDNIDIIWLMEDFGTQKGMMISPQMFEEMIAPYYSRFFQWIRANTSWKIFFHTCGGVYPIIDTLIDCGIDILNPVQTSAVGMEAEKLKAEFGDRLTFWGGGIDTQSVLPFGSPKEIEDQVKERIQTLAPNGGFVFATIHNIQEDVAPEKIAAMLQAVRAYGQYPLTLGSASQARLHEGAINGL